LQPLDDIVFARELQKLPIILPTRLSRPWRWSRRCFTLHRRHYHVRQRSRWSTMSRRRIHKPVNAADWWLPFAPR